jgi:hypothetical protein
MSRSYKKNPGYADRNPWAKNQANRKVRRTFEVPNNGGYKRLYCSYNIRDYKYLWFTKRRNYMYSACSTRKYRRPWKPKPIDLFGKDYFWKYYIK